MLALLVALSVIVLVAAGVLVFAAGPARGRDVPGVPGLAERIGRVLPGDPPPAHGMLSSPERDRQARDRFERAERSVRRLLSPTSWRSRLPLPPRHRG